MDFYGNKMWNNATDNRDKLLVPMNEDEFLKVTQQLEASGINYYAYAKENKAVMAVNNKDIDWLKRILGEDFADMHTRKSEVAYTLPEKNIIGNTEFRYIPQKDFLSMDSDFALKVAELMNKENIQFSGRVYPSGKATLTITRSDLEKVKAIQQTVVDMRKQFAEEKQTEILGNKEHSDIEDKHYFVSMLTPDKYKEIKPFIDTNIEYSGVIRDGKVMFTVEKENTSDFMTALENARREADIVQSLKTAGLDEDKISRLSDIIHGFAIEDMHTSLDTFFDKKYDELQFAEMESLTRKYLSQSVTERYGEQSALSEMLDAKNRFDRSIELEEYFSEHSYTAEQKSAIADMFNNNGTRIQIEVLDETFTPEDIKQYDYLLHNCINPSDVTSFLENHRNKVGEEKYSEQENTQFIEAIRNHKDIYILSENEPEQIYPVSDAAKTEFFNMILHYDSEMGYVLQADTDKTEAAVLRVLGDDISEIKNYLDEHNLNFGEIKEITESIDIPKSITLEQAGSFYEIYGENAKEAAEILNLTLTEKNGVEMVGFPDFSYDSNAEKLENAGFMLTVNKEKSVELDDTPLFTDADVIEEITKSERAEESFADSQVYATKSGQLSFFGDEVPLEQVKSSPRTRNKEDFYSNIAPNANMIDHILKCGGDSPHSLERIVYQFQKNKSLTENADFLREEFNNASRGYIYHEDSEHKLAADFNNDGITIAVSETAYPKGRNAHITWEMAAERIEELLEKGNYCSQSVIDNALKYEKGVVAEDLSLLRQDVNIEYFIPDHFYNEGYTESKMKIAEALNGELPLMEFTEGLRDLVNKYEENPDVLRFHFHNPRELLSRLEDLQGKHRQFTARADFEFSPKFFMSEEDKNKLINKGSSVSEGKFRIYDYFTEEHSQKEKADFLKHEYGIGGYSAMGFYENHDAKGIQYSKGKSMFNPDCEVFMKWEEVARRIDKMISQDKYVSKESLDKRLEKMVDIVKKTDPETTDYAEKYNLKNATEVLERYGIEVENDSKHITELTVFHGTTADFDTFKPDYRGAVWTTTDMESAQRYAGSLDDSKIIVSKAKLENPKYIEYGNGENWDIDKTIFDAKSEGYDSVVIDFKFDKADNGFYRHAVENFPDENANTILGSIINAGSTPKDNETIGEFDKRMRENDNVVHSYVAVLDSTKLEITDRISVADKSEQLENNTPEPEITEQKSQDNFVISDDTGTGGAKTKFKNNIAAIETLKTLEKENRPATDEEKTVLSQYVGWGGLAQAFDKDNASWEKEYTQLKDVLTDKEYTSARASVLDAFFTSPTVIDSIYEALDNFGFKGGNVLEPAMGVGNFFGRMPEDMHSNSKLYGIEIDSISGRIAQHIYPDADIAIKGFEKNNFQNGCFDVAVGNVPFGELSFTDEKHGTNKLHDYFFAETLDKVKDGGIVAFVTSAGTLDKRDESTRKALSEKADFVGAIRLPGGKNGAFKDIANTEVTTDIIFLQKNENKQTDISKENWISIGETADGLPINNYFAENPDMVLGTVIEGNKLYGTGTMVVAEKGADLKEQLETAVSKLSATISDVPVKDVYAKSAEGLEVKIPSNLRNYSLFEQDNNIYFKKNDSSCHCCFDAKHNQYKRAKAFISLRDTTRELIEAQTLNKPDSEIKALQDKLNTVYDDFYKKYGLIHSQSNKRYFSNDVSYNLVAGLEKKYEKTELKEKSDIFTKRTIQPPKAVEHVETAMEALTLSVAEKASVDFEYMSNLTGMSETELKKDLQGQIFKVPHTENTYQTASEYLSGDIRQKLNVAEEVAEYNADFNENVVALKEAMPEPLKAGDIEVKIGATWINPKYYEQFMYETFKTPNDNRNDVKHPIWYKPKLITAEYSEHTGTWHINNKSQDRSVMALQQYGSKKMNAYDIMEHILNLKDPKIYKTVEVPDGYGETKEKRVVDVDATRVVQRKADKIKEEFKKWIFKDPERREEIVGKYNELFNSVRPREFDGSALSFPMMNAEIKLHEHQKNAVAHAMFGGNTLFAHSVGAGKTFEMIATAMESKRLGLCTKSMFAVPNHLTEQIGDDFQKLYPSANVLVATKKDFQKENRQQLFAKIATGNFDAVIIGHSQLGMIPISKERQENMLQSQINDILAGIEELKKSEGSRFQIKAMERTKKSLEKNLEKLQKNHDDTINFEQLGVDKLFVDEAHEFKNLFTPTKLSNISGISNSASQKALDLFMKCQYLDEKTGGKGIVFATGTPISNSVTELHTMMRYLEYDFLKSKNLQHFDNWITVFGEQKTEWELAPAGNKFKERTRIANYTGIPELMSMFKQVADIRTADTLKLDVPDCEYKVVNVEATPFQKELVDELADRADAINSGNVDPTIDNMLRITSDGRKLGLDPRLIDPSFEDNPNTKLNQCVENVARIHADTAENKLTQIIFCDLGVPHKTTSDTEKTDGDEEKSSAERDSLEEECDFCVYDDIRKKLIDKGIPENEIAYIHSAKSEKQKSELFDKVRSGEVRVLLGSTSKMGTGTNVQKKLVAVHDLDIPWRPADLERAPVKVA